MADKVMALYGKGCGPWIPVHDKAVTLVLKGDQASELLCRVLRDCGTVVEQRVCAGEELPSGSFVQLESESRLMCYLQMVPADAV